MVITWIGGHYLDLCQNFFTNRFIPVMLVYLCDIDSLSLLVRRCPSDVLQVLIANVHSHFLL